MSPDGFFRGDTQLWNMVAIFGLACISVLARSFFFIARSQWHLPHWAQRGLQYAPLAALSAVIAPEVVMSHGQLIDHWQDARIYAVVAGVAFFVWRRGAGQAVLGTILAGMAVYLPLHIGLGW